MEGTARAPAAGTVLNALATGTGSAFAIEEYTTAQVTLDDQEAVEGEITGAPDADTRLIERCVELVTAEYGEGQGGSVTTKSEVPMASGLKSSSAAANATVLATLSALGKSNDLSREEAARIGVAAARDVGVTITGAFDDASASMLGGVTVTDNTADTVLHREECEWGVLVWTPPEQSFSADADVAACKQITPMAEFVAELALDGEFERAMTVNGLAFCAALGFDSQPMVEVMSAVDGVSLSGTGPSFTAVGDEQTLAAVRSYWDDRPGTTMLTSTQTDGALVTD